VRLLSIVGRELPDPLHLKLARGHDYFPSSAD
jgi:hypothetical protein